MTKLQTKQKTKLRNILIKKQSVELSPKEEQVFASSSITPHSADPTS